MERSASLKCLLRNPIGYLWEYGLGWSAPYLAEEPLMLDPAAYGNLAHEILEVAAQTWNVIWAWGGQSGTYWCGAGRGQRHGVRGLGCRRRTAAGGQLALQPGPGAPAEFRWVDRGRSGSRRCPR